MPRMTAADAAVAILRREGVTHAFGLPGAAINPFYAALRSNGTIGHTLARHVEGASHMAEGYTRTKAGNIGVCVGTSGPAGTDMITGLYSASADSIPILAITGQAPVARLHKEDFQAVDISAIPAPVTKMAMTVLEPGQVPGAFAKAFHLMRSGRPGPVLIDLPIDVQLAEIDFDPEAYQPLPLYKPAATRGQAEKVLDMLVTAERPLIVAGGGIINADASDLLVELAETLDIPVIPTLMGWGTIPDDHRLGQPTHRRTRDLPQGKAIRPRRRRSHPNRAGLLPRPRHRVRRQGRTRATGGGRQGEDERRHPADVEQLGPGLPGAQADDAP